jgi:HAD superfamily hydrolase (TIGR01490 family)
MQYLLISRNICNIATLPYDTAMPKKTKLAIFDIDGTVFRGSLIIELFHELVRAGIFPLSAKLEVERDYLKWLNRKGHYNDYLMKLVRVFYRTLAGCSVRRMAPAIRAVIRWQKDRVHRYPRQLIRELRQSGYYLLVISNSPEPVVRQFAKAMGFDASIGHVLEVVDGIYTGRSMLNGAIQPGMAWMDKVAILNQFIAENGLVVDEKHSVMIGDSEGDLPLLSRVAIPIAFNPSLPLAKIARKRGWRIVVERKDVVYEIEDASFIAVTGQLPKVPYGNKKH